MTMDVEAKDKERAVVKLMAALSRRRSGGRRGAAHPA
jgi:hypothetical protein